MKKINSEIKFNNNLFKIKVGTINKKYPNTIYFEIGTYIAPSTSFESYSDNLNGISRKIRSHIQASLIRNDNFSRDFIFIHNVATDRMNVGKKSYFEIQAYIKPSKELITSKTFKQIAETVNDDCNGDFIPFIENNMIENGYSLSKIKA